MAKNFKKELSAVLALLMCAGTMSTAAFADEPHERTHLLGDAEGDLKTFNFKVVDEYIPADGEERYAVVGSGEQTEFWTAYLFTTPAKESEIPVVVIDETPYYNRGSGKKINGVYLDGVFYPAVDIENHKGSGENSYISAPYNGLQQAMLMNGSGKKVAVYCADHVVSTTTDALYDVVNIEDATHYDEDTAGKIRAVAANGYWGGTETVDQYGTLAKMKSMMEDSQKFTKEEIDLLSPGVALSATQFALWELANADDDRQVVNVQYIEKDRVNSLSAINPSTGIREYWNDLRLTPAKEIPCVDLIFKLSNYLVNLAPIPAVEMTTGNTVLTDKVILKDVAIDVLAKDYEHENNRDADKDNDAYVTNVTFDMLEVREKDNLYAKIVDKEGNVYAIGRIAGERQDDEVELIANGDDTYTFPGITLIENEETTYTVVVEGVQYLERNVYLYTAGKRETSQTLIGYDEGYFTVDVESSVKETFNVDDPTVSFESGKASNISFMLLDENGKVEFLDKIDIENETSFEIPFEAGKISAVFIKQSTSGMFWFSKKVGEDQQQAVIECLIDNNPSYKGHNAVAFGAGEHELEFKEDKFAVYSFTGDFMNKDGETVTVDSVDYDEDEGEEIVEEELDEEVEEEANNGSKKDKNNKKDKKNKND